MAWARLDDGFSDHPKVLHAWNRSRGAVGMYAMALAWVAKHERDGLVSREWTEMTIPDPRERDAAVTALVDAGLWTDNGEGWEIHDYLAYNPSKNDTAARREADRKRKRSGTSHA